MGASDASAFTQQSLDRFERVFVNVSMIHKTTGDIVGIASFKPSVDGAPPGSMSALEDFNSSTSMTNANLYSDTYVELSIQGKNTSDDNPDKEKVQYLWLEDGKSYYAPFLTALVTLNEGKVQKVRWNWEGEGSRFSCGSGTVCHNDLYCGLSKDDCDKRSDK